MRSKFLIVLLAFAQQALGQPGNYFLSHYAPSDERVSSLTFALAQDNRGILHIANRSGILEFDGHTWNLIATQSPVFTIVSCQQGIYAGGFQGFGKIVFGADHTQTYQLLSQQQPAATQIFSSLLINDKIYFANSHAVFVLSPQTDQIESVLVSDVELNGLIEITGNVYAKTDQGLKKIIDGKFVSPSFPWTDDLAVDFTASNKKFSLLGVSGSRLFLATSSGLTEIKIADRDYLIRNVAISAAWLSEDLVAVGTLRGGVIFLNPNTGETQEITNFYTGLPDNEVYALLTDHNHGLWVAHDYGFTRIAPTLPFRLFSHYMGLEGNLLCARTFNGQTYVGTTLGLFMLATQDVTEGGYINQQPVSPTKENKKRKGLFSFLKRKTSEAEKPIASKPITKSTYLFKRVNGVEGKVLQLLETDNQLLAAGNFGVVSVNGLKAEEISRIPVRSVFKSAAISQLLASTQEDEIKTFALTKGHWKETRLFDTLNDYVSYIFEDKLENIWLCGRTQAIKIETVDGAVTAVERISFSNPTVDESMGLAYGSEVYMATGGSFHRYDLKENIFKKYDSLPGTKKYFASAGYFWFYDGHRWNTVDKRMQAALRLEWLGLFSNIRFIGHADKESLWVITSGNELYKFSPTVPLPDQYTYPLFLKEVHGQQNKQPLSRSIKVSQLESTISFEYVQAGYLGSKAVEYRYKVNGLDNDWTHWSVNNNTLNFSYLPAGKYKIEVQTRNMMGKITNAEAIVLEVAPPYWRQSWFYLVEILFFGGMVFLSMRLSSGNPKYRLISQLLSLLTIVMIIQFVQAVVSTQVSIKDSPVLDFFLQVGVALLILPVEGYLRRFIVRKAI
ncbi:MAG: hypothetical protein JSS93_14050 [Bacteroidetes bacterium]|nr:hypothetical protein [Bacteroidota bacterium]